MMHRSRTSVSLKAAIFLYVLTCAEPKMTEMEFVISTTWNSLPVDHEPVKVTFSPGDGGMKMQVSAPFFNDPPGPSGPPGQPFPGLWDYEVVEAFFLDSTTVNYLEVELCPHGQHLVLLLSGRGHAFMQQLPLSFTATITGNRWEGEALLPWFYFPPNINKMNSYAIHGSGAGRTYESLYPVPQADLVEGQKPNFCPRGKKPLRDFTMRPIVTLKQLQSSMAVIGEN